MSNSYPCASLSHYSTGLDPPVSPSFSASLSSQFSEIGSRLVTVVRLLEQECSSSTSVFSSLSSISLPLWRECVEILHTLVQTCWRRCGLLENDTAINTNLFLKNSFISTNNLISTYISDNSPIKSRHGTSTRARRKKVRSSIREGDVTGSASSAYLDTTLALQGLHRIISNKSLADSDLFVLVTLAGDFCIAASESIQQKRQAIARTQNASSQALLCQTEMELMASFPWIVTWQSQLKRIISSNAATKTSAAISLSSGLYVFENREHVMALVSTLRAIASFIRLSSSARGTCTNWEELSTLSWKALSVVHYTPFTTASVDPLDRNVAWAAALLISSLPFHTTDPSDLWLRTWNETTASMELALQSVAPIVDRAAASPSNSIIVPFPIHDWIRAIQETSESEAHRVESFVHLMSSLVRILRCLLGDGHMPRPVVSVLIIDSLNVKALLDMCETLMCFGSSAEAIFFRTKKRLRTSVMVGNGVLSASSIVQMANSLKVLGLDLLSSTISAIGSPTLFPFVRRIYKITGVVIRTSCSTSVRAVLEPGILMEVATPINNHNSDRSSSNIAGTKSQRWLHTSIPARTHAVRSFEKCLGVFGYPASSGVSTSDSLTGNGMATRDVDDALTLVAGCLLEQVVYTRISSLKYTSTPHWGSLEEKIQLVLACCNCFEVCLLSSTGAFISEPTRAIIDNVVYTCLQQILESCGGDGDKDPLTVSPSIRQAFLSMGMASVKTPLCNGATTSSQLFASLEEAARALRDSGDPDCSYSVLQSSSHALSLCAQMSTSRVPALIIVKDGGSGCSDSNLDSFAKRIISPKVLLNRMEIAQIEAVQRFVELTNSMINARKSYLSTNSDATTGGETMKLRDNLSESPSNDSAKETVVVPSSQVAANVPAKSENLITSNHQECEVIHSSIHSQAIVVPTALEGDKDEDDLPRIVDAEPDDED